MEILGIAAASAIATYISAIFETAGGLSHQVTDLLLDPWSIVMDILLACRHQHLRRLDSGAKPARVDPVQALQKGKYQVLSAERTVGGDGWRLQHFQSLSCACISLDSKVFFYTGYVLMISAGLLLAPTLTLLLAKALRPILRGLLPAEGTLAADSLVQAPRRTSATVSALMLSLAMVVGFGGFTHSFFSSVEEWMNNALNPDFFVTTSQNLAARSLTFHETSAR